MRRKKVFSDIRWRRLAMGTAAALVVAAPSSAEAATPNLDPHPAVRSGALGPLADVAARRILLGDKVAAAKFGTGRPIDDPVRERQELDAVAAMASRSGISADASVGFFEAQISANKVVQRGLYALWTERPGLRPRVRPDLASVRPELDRLTTEIMRQLKATRDVRADTAGCRELLIEARRSAELRFGLDALHRKALTVALRTVCASP